MASPAKIRLMCLITFAYRAHPEFPLVMIANRDEFHARPTAPLHWWEDQPNILAGRDLRENGGWLGVSRSGRMAAVTNVRGNGASDPAPRSRGHLVRDCLSSDRRLTDFARQMEPIAHEFGGFNLLLFDGEQLFHATNRPHWQWSRIEPGVHALSNASLDTPWPKSLRVQQAMADWAGQDGAPDDALFAALANQDRPSDEELPETGVGLELERLLSTAFIQSPTYGTRCTSLVKFAPSGNIEFVEKSFAPDGSVSGHVTESFRRSI